MSDHRAPAGHYERRGLSAAAMFATNLLLALVWVALTVDFDVGNFGIGFVLAYAILYILQHVVGRTTYFIKSWRLVTFAAFYALEVVRSNIRVAVDVVTPASRAQPGIVAVPLDCQTDAEIALLANLITMTPGSLSVDVSDDRRVIYIHSMFIDDPEAFRRSIKTDFERRVLELLR